MDILLFAQVTFYLVASLAIIVLGLFLAVVAYHLIYVARNLHTVSGTLKGFIKRFIH